MKTNPILAFLLHVSASLTDQWPYNRVIGEVKDSGKVVADPSKPQFEEHPDNLFVAWLHDVINKNENLTSLQKAFVNGTVPDDAKWFDDILDNIDVPAIYTPRPIKKSPLRPNFPQRDAVAI